MGTYVQLCTISFISSANYTPTTKCAKSALTLVGRVVWWSHSQVYHALQINSTGGSWASTWAGYASTNKRICGIV